MHTPAEIIRRIKQKHSEDDFWPVCNWQSPNSDFSFVLSFWLSAVTNMYLVTGDRDMRNIGEDIVRYLIDHTDREMWGKTVDTGEKNRGMLKLNRYDVCIGEKKNAAPGWCRLIWHKGKLVRRPEILADGTIGVPILEYIKARNTMQEYLDGALYEECITVLSDCWEYHGKAWRTKHDIVTYAHCPEDKGKNVKVSQFFWPHEDNEPGKVYRGSPGVNQQLIFLTMGYLLNQMESDRATDAILLNTLYREDTLPVVMKLGGDTALTAYDHRDHYKISMPEHTEDSGHFEITAQWFLHYPEVGHLQDNFLNQLIYHNWRQHAGEFGTTLDGEDYHQPRNQHPGGSFWATAIHFLNGHRLDNIAKANLLRECPEPWDHKSLHYWASYFKGVAANKEVIRDMTGAPIDDDTGNGAESPHVHVSEPENPEKKRLAELVETLDMSINQLQQARNLAIKQMEILG